MAPRDRLPKRTPNTRPVRASIAASGGRAPFSPTIVRGRRPGTHLQLLAIEQREQEALVGRAAFHDDHRLGQRAAQPRDRLPAVAAPGDQLDYQRVEVGRDHVAFGHAGVDPDAGARGEPQQRDPARRGQEAERRILGAQTGLDRVARRVRRLTLQPAARGHVQLELDEVKPGDRLGHRMLDLQAGVDFHEREATLRGLVEELNGPRVAVARAQRQPARRLHHLALLLAGQRRAGRLLDHLLVAAPAAAVAQTDRPRRALAVRDHLDLDLAGRRHDPLEEQRAVAERLQRLRPRARKDGGQLAGRVHAADPAPAAADRRLDHEREADPLRVALSLLKALDRAAAPWRDRDAGRLGQPLGLDLVADATHHRRVRADEHDAQPVAELDKLRVLGHEAPADPRRVGAGSPQRTLERRVIQVRAAACAVRCRDRARSHADGLVGVTDEHRLALRVGIERDEPDLLDALVVELTDGANDRIAGSPRLTTARRRKRRCISLRPSPRGSARQRPGHRADRSRRTPKPHAPGLDDHLRAAAAARRPTAQRGPGHSTPAKHVTRSTRAASAISPAWNSRPA